MSVALTLLGCGSSGGVPRVAQGWGACDPANPRNSRRRCSALLEASGADGRTLVLIDTSPDLRLQLIDAGVARLDGVLMTHPHADHTHGIDDLRPLVIAMRKRIEIHMNEATSADVRAKFAYVFESPAGSSYPPILRERRLAAGTACVISGPGGPIERPRSNWSMATFQRSASGSARSPIPLISMAFPTRACRSSRVSTSGSSTLCATPRIPRISVSTKRSLGSSGCVRACGSDQSAYRSRL